VWLPIRRACRHQSIGGPMSDQHDAFTIAERFLHNAIARVG
jgi:hypothetical protein